jgi:hypothetical protein
MGMRRIQGSMLSAVFLGHKDDLKSLCIKGRNHIPGVILASVIHDDPLKILVCLAAQRVIAICQ